MGEWLAKAAKHSLQMRCGDEVLGFDRSGRFIRFATSGTVIRRSLSGQIVRVTGTAGRHNRRYESLPPHEANDFLAKTYDSVRCHVAPTEDALITDWMHRINAWTPETLSDDAENFRRVYLPVSILPPGEYESVVVQVTEGCSYNRCLFCDFYRDRPFHIKNSVELVDHLQRIRTFFGDRLPDRSGVFLGDGNALIVPLDRLLEALDLISLHLPEVAGSYSTFMDTFNLANKSQADLIRLRNKGLHTVYVGLESGYDGLREKLRKPGSAEDALKGIEKLKAAGFRIGVIVLAGVGTHQDAAYHRADTLELLRRAALEPLDTVFVSPFVEPSNQSFVKETRGWQQSFSYDDSFAEAQSWMTSFRRELSAKVSLYSILEHFY